MRLENKIALVIIATAAALFSAASTRAERIPRIELLRQVRVGDGDVLLSDLLPKSVHGSLRSRAEGISLGAAPQFGNIRTLDRDAVLNQVNVPRPGLGSDILSEITVPERIAISRESRAITLSEVLGAIRTALDQNGALAGRSLRPENVLLQSQVLVGPGDAGLEVVRMEVDAGLRRAKFLLWTSLDPAVLPFIVTARLDGDIPLDSIHPARMNRSRTALNISQATTPEPKQEILVSPGVQATMLVRSASFQMFADVAPLERGTLGQRIRVRVIDTGKIFNAQVDGRAHLDVKF